MRLLLKLLLLLFVINGYAQGVGYYPFPGTYFVVPSNAAVGGVTTSSIDVYFDFYKAGVTDAAGQGAGMSNVQVVLRYQGINADGTYSNANAIYGTYTATYVSDWNGGSDDRYKVTIPAGLPNGRYSWESYATQGGITYSSWDYNTFSGNSLQYFTVGPVGIFRSMIIIDNNGTGNTYYDMLKFQPGNASLPAKINGPLSGGFCSSNSLILKGGELNTFKNTGAGYASTNISGTRIYYRLTAISATNTPPSCLNGSSAWNSITLNFRDDCPGSSFSGGGSCTYKDNGNTDQRWDNTSANINLMTLASSTCMPSNSTGPVTYRLDIYTEADEYADGSYTGRDPASGYYSTTFTVSALESSSSNGFDAGPGCTVLLPLPLIKQFNGIRNGKDALLNWKTENESTNIRYELQRSTTRNNFTTVYTTYGKGGNNNNYRFTDAGIFRENNTEYFYRLKIQTNTGEIAYSNIVRLKQNSVEGISTVQPNPFSNQLNFSVHLTANNQLSISLIDVLGRRVIAQTKNYTAGTQTINLQNLQSLPKGVYFLEIRNEEGSLLLTEKLLH